MKILLIGEFSGVHNNLKKGLISLGHDVKLAADGDGYRKFGFDFRIAPYKGRVWGKILNVLYFIFNIKKFIGNDVIQFINPYSIPFYYHYFGISHFIFKYNKKSVYYACGTDPAFIAARDKFDYFPFDNPSSDEYPHYKRIHLKYYDWFIKKIDVIVPSMYTYAVGYFGNAKLISPRPLPGSSNYIDEVKQISGKIKILFGITRPNFKGAKIILEALNEIKEKYYENVEIVVVEKLPFAEYERILKNSDILIDQCKSYDFGMNAIFGMENGLIVFSGAEKVAMNYLKFDDCPVININNNLSQIVDVVSKIIELEEPEFNKLKKKSLYFAKNNLELNSTAAMFLKNAYLKSVEIN